MKIQPIDFDESTHGQTRTEAVKPPVAKSRLKRLFERQFPSVLKLPPPPEKSDSHCNKDASGDFEPSSVCLAKMVQNFIEQNNDKHTGSRCGRNRCKCFNKNCNDSSEDELDSFNCCFGDQTLTSSSADACEILKSLVPSASLSEKNLLADTSKIVAKNKISKRKDDYCRKVVTDGLIALGYDASVCRSRWEKSPTHPAGEYEYVDVMIGGERLIIDIDFRSEFEIARSTKSYKSVLQALPATFVGKDDRLQKIVTVVSEAAKQSLKKKGMHFPPWRKAEYVKAKWLSPFTRITAPPTTTTTTTTTTTHLNLNIDNKQSLIPTKSSSCDELGLSSEEEEKAEISPVETDHIETMFALSDSSGEDEK